MRKFINAEPRDLGDTSLLEEKEWLKWRQHGPLGDIPFTVGASDTAAVLDISPWTTSRELWSKKIGEQMNYTEERNKWAKAQGHIYEPYVAEVFKQHMEKEGHSVGLITDKHIYQCGEVKRDDNGNPVIGTDGKEELKYPFALVNLDGTPIVDGEMVLLECKTTSSHNFESIKKWKAGIVPKYYDCQVRYCMAVMNIDVAYICCVWGLGPDDYAVIQIDRDPDYEEYLMEQVENFVENCKTKKEPDTSKCNPLLLADFYTRLYGTTKAKEVIDISTFENADIIFKKLKEIAKKIERNEAEMTKLKKEEENLLNNFAEYYGDYESLKYESKTMRAFIQVKSQMTRGGIDKQLLTDFDATLVALGEEFDGSTFKKRAKDKLKELRKEIKQKEKVGDISAADDLQKDVDHIEKALEISAIPSVWKGTQTKTVTFYDAV